MTESTPAGDKTPHTNSQPGREVPRIRVSSVAGFLAVIPHLLGFHPTRSMVVVGLDARRGRIVLAFRYDLPDPPDAAVSRDIAEHAAAVLRKRRIRTAIAAGYGDGTLVTPVAEQLRAGLRGAGIGLRDLLRVQDGRYWSYVCTDPGCCPPEGVPFDVASHPAAAALTAAGMSARPDRASLAASLAPLTGQAAESMREATERAVLRAAELIASSRASGSASSRASGGGSSRASGSASSRASGSASSRASGGASSGASGGAPARSPATPGGAPARTSATSGNAPSRTSATSGNPSSRIPATPGSLWLVVEAGREAVRAAISIYRHGGQITDHDQLAWLTVTIADLRVRDDAWARMDPRYRADHQRLWTDVARHAREPYVPAPASLLAFTAWQSGDGALANVAIERALAADPEYSMAHLIGRALDAGLPPSAARLPMTPEEVEASYAGTERGGTGRSASRSARGSASRSSASRSSASRSSASRSSASRSSAGRSSATRSASKRPSA
jgi:Domain of unknown function (DUF4192)